MRRDTSEGEQVRRTAMIRIRLTNRIATKLIAALAAVIIIPTFCIGFFFYRTSSELVKNNVRQSTVQIAEQAADSLSNILNVGSDTSDLVYGQAKIQQMVLQDSEGVSDDVKVENRDFIANLLNNIIYSNSFVKIIYILKGEGSSWGSGVFNQAKVDRYRIRDFPWIREAERLDGRLAWTQLQYDKFSGGGDNTDLVIPAARVLKNFKTMENIGYVVINVDGRAVLDKLRQLRLGKTGAFFVADSQGRVMIDPNESRIGREVGNAALKARIADASAREFEYEEDGVRFYGVKEPLSNGWSIVGVVPLSEITGQLDELHDTVFVLSGGFALLAVLVGLVFARRITRPIHKLVRQMKLAGEGDLNARASVESSDEIGLMSNQFNRMLHRLDRTMAQVREERDKKQRAEMRAVMHRINPHFMFNTLSTIKWLVKFGDTAKAYEGLAAFTRLLEANMGKKGHMVSLDEELEIIAKYLEILQLRYTLTFDLKAEMDRELGSFRVPRMLIQPIVENAIFHGFVPENRNGAIAIAAVDEGQAVRIRIEDDGVGIEASRLERILRDDGEYGRPGRKEGAVETGGTGIGLRHVKECIQLYYPFGSRLEIESEPGRGTVVQLILIKPKPEAE
ncbi:sensor histidine kinase [Cohnella xylanilytica]|uniref:histidine kinase n=1 Tax=Cohnella xylanilytica TaxID=557555 RepID=A0A841U1R4_9BACL|nr:sensor histidine kinase [Cohnella xylanilytica]MBB6691874.1 sensor histidine kinase [Cohnella xylanilytica]